MDDFVKRKHKRINDAWEKQNMQLYWKLIEELTQTEQERLLEIDRQRLELDLEAARAWMRY